MKDTERNASAIQDSLIQIKGLYKNFGKLQVLKGVSAEIKKGEKVVIIGPSGSGKSTFLRCMNLLETPTYGEIWFEGKLLTPIDPYLHFDVIRYSKTYKKMLEASLSTDVSREETDARIIADIKRNDLLKKHEGKEYSSAIRNLYRANFSDINVTRQKIGMVFQHFNLFNNLTVMQNLMLAPVQLKLKNRFQAEERGMELLERIGLADKAGAYPSTLSGGQKQRIAIAGVLALKPEILVLDESTAMLDPQGRKEIAEVIGNLRKSGVAVIAITHYMDEAVKADKVLVIDRGNVALSGTPKEVFAQKDALGALGLELPLAGIIADKLRAQGADIPEDVITEEELLGALWKL